MDFRGHQLKLVESRIEVPVADEQKTYQLWFEKGVECPFEDFDKSIHNNGFFITQFLQYNFMSNKVKTVAG